MLLADQMLTGKGRHKLMQGLTAQLYNHI